MRRCFPHRLTFVVMLWIMPCTISQARKPEWKLSGCVTSESGNPLQGVLVESAWMHDKGETQTDAKGDYELILRPSGENPAVTHFVRFRLTGYKTVLHNARVFLILNLQHLPQRQSPKHILASE
jgi:hypothetical protein